jgi:hypothetical protein
MAHAEQISTLRRRRSALIGRMTLTRCQLDDYEENKRVDKNYLISCSKSFEENWMKIIAVQNDLDMLSLETRKNLSVYTLYPKNTTSLTHEYWISSSNHIPPSSRDSQNASPSMSPNRHRLNYRRCP